MTTLADPTFASIILQRAEEIARRPAGARDPEAVRVQADSLRHLKEFTSALRQLVEDILAYGSEVQEFLRTCGPLADVTDRITSRAEAILQRLTPAADPDSENLAAELQSLRDGAKLLHSLLAGAMRAAQTPPNPVDWGRIHKADEAFQHGETKPFQRR